jgi:hypothetical protein
VAELPVRSETSGDGALARARLALAAGLTPRAVLVGTACVVLVSFVTSWAELVVQRIALGVIQFPPGAFGVFVLLIITNRLVRRLRPRWALQAGELAICYAMMLMSAMTASRGAPRRLISLLTTINYSANPSNRWQEMFFQWLPPSLLPWNTAGEPLQPNVLAMYEGLHYGEPIPWHPWVMPLLRWSVVILLVFGSFMCLGALLRRQWVDNERLSFPLAQLPIEMLRAETGEPFYRNRLLYLGAALPVVIHLVNLAHNIDPNMPQIALTFDLRRALFPGPPLSAMTTFRIYLSLAAIGFFFLLPAELLFSFWFFYLVVTKGHEIVLLTLGQTLERPGHADTSLYLTSAEAGGFFVLAAYFLWMARPVLLAALRGRGGQDEMVRYRTALIGLIITLVAAAVWYQLVGLALWLGVMEFVVYILVIALVMTRATAEGGLLMTEIIFTPLDVYGMFGKRQLLGARNLTMSVFATEPFAGDMRGLTLQGIMDSQRIADGIGLRRRSLYWGLWIGIIAALLAGFFIQLWINYRIGAMALSGQYSWLTSVFLEEHQAFLNGEERQHLWAPISFFLGAGFTVLLTYLRLQFFWWPLHPLGFVMCGSWSLVVYWFPIFAAWVIKTVIVHYSGLSGYRRARPYFLGLILGEMTIAVVLTLLDAIWHIPAPYIPFD